jgi:hypothetical protein
MAFGRQRGIDPDETRPRRRDRRFHQSRAGVGEKATHAAIMSCKGPWRLSASEALHRALRNQTFAKEGLVFMDALSTFHSDMRSVGKPSSTGHKARSNIQSGISTHRLGVMPVPSTLSTVAWTATKQIPFG